jgi:hypothetical protein
MNAFNLTENSPAESTANKTSVVSITGTTRASLTTGDTYEEVSPW